MPTSPKRQATGMRKQDLIFQILEAQTKSNTEFLGAMQKMG